MGNQGELSDYRSKRDFRSTPEPSGPQEAKHGDEPLLVIQEHEAGSHHYDLRLQVGDVLKSWAVPKGPSTDPRDKRLAVPTEDHPLAYADFEGVIPEEEYGGGSVIVWDRGTYRNLMADKDEPLSMEDALERGHLEVWLEGEKLSGGFALIRTGAGGDARWLLVKMKDGGADARRKPTSTQPRSVLSGRTVAEMAGEEDDS